MGEGLGVSRLLLPRQETVCTVLVTAKYSYCHGNSYCHSYYSIGTANKTPGAVDLLLQKIDFKRSN